MENEEKVKIANMWPMGLPTQMPITTDPNGAYTGRPLDRKEIPVQDVDDL